MASLQVNQNYMIRKDGKDYLGKCVQGRSGGYAWDTVSQIEYDCSLEYILHWGHESGRCNTLTIDYFGDRQRVEDLEKDATWITEYRHDLPRKSSRPVE